MWWLDSDDPSLQNVIPAVIGFKTGPPQILCAGGGKDED